MKRFALLVAILLIGGTAAGAKTSSRTLSVRVARPVLRANTMTVSDASGSGETNYPLQFGRPFIRGAIPSGQLPQVLVNGTAVPTQADVKNRYPDGSVEFAIVAAVIPSIPANGSVTLTFAPTTGDSNTPLTAAQMEGVSYNFAAQERLTTPARLPGVKGTLWDAKYRSTAAMNAITNGGFNIAINGHNCSIANFNLTGTGLNFGTMIASQLSRCAGATVTWVLVSSDPGGWGVELTTSAGTIGYATPPAAGQTDLSEIFGLSQATGAVLVPASGPNTQIADALTMLKNGDYVVWTSGPVAQTIVLGDDTPARKYDLGFGPNGASGGYHPFRPRFEATFWPQTHQVYVRAIGENGLTTELEDIGPYNLTLTAANAQVYSHAALTQPAMSTWTRTFWLGGTPNQQVNIDNNLAYLESTRFIPNYDPAVTISPSAIANDYATWWTNTPHDIGQPGYWTPGMTGTGARPDIGPEPSWAVAWLYTGDWRMRQAALGLADLAASWTVNLRESDPAMRLNRADPMPAPGQTGSGYGKPISTTDRTQIGPNGLEGGGEGDFLYYNSDNQNPPNILHVVGQLCLNSSGAPCSGWDFASSHEPAPFFVPYILTGDPFYLTELEMWAAYDAFVNNADQRGLGGQGGGLAHNELRGSGWILRSRAETAFAIPDGDPLKTYFTILTQEDIASWEGALGVADPVLAANPLYAFGQSYGDPHSDTRFGTPAPAPALHNWEAYYNSDDPTLQGAAVNALGATNPWMQWYTQYALGRAAELGFAAGPLAQSSGSYLIGLINATGYPKLIGAYLLPAWTASGQITSWPQFVANLETPWLTGTGYKGPSGNALPSRFNGSLYAQGYDGYAESALAPLVDEGAPGAAQAWAWVKPNVHDPLMALTTFGGPGFLTDPSWAIVPRTDSNTLPAQPLTPQ